MSLKEEISEKIADYMESKYDITNASAVPDKKSISFGPQAKKLWATVIYVDLRDSRKLLADNSEKAHIQACKAHKSFIYAASKCTRYEGGELRSFNGDSILSFFTGDDAAKRAVRAAMKTEFVTYKIINPALEQDMGKTLDFGIGIAQGYIYIVKSGVPGDEIYQDLIWMGRPTYHAFECGSLARSPYNIWISENIYKSIEKDNTMIYANGKNMWTPDDTHQFTIGKVRIFKTNYYWEI